MSRRPSRAPQLFVCGLEAMPGHVRALRPRRLVSLVPPWEQPPTPRGIVRADHLRVEINDIDDAEYVPHEGEIVPRREHIETLVGFLADSPSSVLFHCMAGISRSTAAALIALALDAPGRERESAARLRQAGPHARPNRLMVELADQVLRREGRLVAALDSIGMPDPAAEPALIVVPRRAGAVSRRVAGRRARRTRALERPAQRKAS